jgi:hypothetical protein
VRILFVADEFPWPAVNGYRRRLDVNVRALATLGTVDLLIVCSDARDADPRNAPADVALGRLEVVRTGRSRRPWPVVVAGAVGPRPRRTVWPDWSGAREVLRRWRKSERYDLGWCSHADAWSALHRHFPRPTVVDLDNLEDQSLRLRRVAVGRGSGARALLRTVADRVDEVRWRWLQRRIAADADATIVCSGLDARRLGAPAHVVPNCYPPVGSGDHAPVRTAVAPVVTTISLLLYGPNADGARWLVERVLPRLRDAVPDVRVRLVGRYDEQVADLASRPGVTLVGEVDDVTPELERAALVVVARAARTRTPGGGGPSGRQRGPGGSTP